MTAKEKLLKWVKSQYEKEYDKWNSGLKNSLYEWEDLYEEMKERYENNFKKQ